MSLPSDFDGSLDLVHADVSRVPETMTNNLKVPVVLEISPYYAGTADLVQNWAVDHEIGQPPASRNPSPPATLIPTTPQISTSHESTWVPRGFAVMHAESLGSGLSEGCATSGGVNETLGARAVIDWLAGRTKGYTNILRTTEVTADWWNGRAGMIGTSYNGTLPIAAASTGVLGLEAIIPISAISNWYDYLSIEDSIQRSLLIQSAGTDENTGCDSPFTNVGSAAAAAPANAIAAIAIKSPTLPRSTTLSLPAALQRVRRCTA